MYDDIRQTLPENVRFKIRFIYKAYEELHGYPAIFNINPYISSNDDDDLLNEFMKNYTFSRYMGDFPKDIVVNKDKREQPPEPGYGRMLAQIEQNYRLVDVIKWCTDHPGKDYCQIIISNIPEEKRVQKPIIIQPSPVSSFPLVAAMMVVAIL